MSEEPIELRRVRFKVYHGGLGANVGDCLYVAASWAEAAIKSGIVEQASLPHECSGNPPEQHP